MATQAFTVEKPASGANATVDLPQGEATQLSFSTSEIQGMKLSDTGELVINFTDGGTLVINNFRSLAENEVKLSMEDGTVINTRQLFDTLVADLPPVQITPPLDATALSYELMEGRKYEFTFGNQKPVEVSEQDGALLITFENNGVLVLKNFSEVVASVDAPEIILDGQFLSLREFADGIKLASEMNQDLLRDDPQTDVRHPASASMEDARTSDEQKLAELAQQLAAVEPAAGGDAGGGAGRGGYGFNSSFEPTPINNLDDVGPIGPTALQYGLPNPEEPLMFLEDDFQQPDGPPLPTLSATATGVYEDSLGGGSVLSISADPNSNSAYVTIRISGIPSSWTVDPNGGTYDAATGTWEMVGTAGNVVTGGPILYPPANSDVDINNLIVTALNTSTTTGLHSGTSGSLDVTTDAVADTPDLTANGSTVDEGDDAPITISTNVTDTDGSETIAMVYVRGVPAGFTLSAGTDNGGGEWVLTKAELAGLKITPADPDFNGTIALTVESVAEESNKTDVDFDFTNDTASAFSQIVVKWNPVADPPSVLANNGVDDAQVKEDGTVDVPLVAALSPKDSPDAYLTVTVTGFDPAWGNVTSPVGTFNGAGTEWTITLASGTNLSTYFTFTPNAQSDIDLSGLVATAVATEPATGTTASATDGFNVIVDAVADDPSINATGGTDVEGTTIAVNISGALGVDTDGSEHIDHYEVSGVPVGFTFNQGTNLGGGIWSFTPAQLAGLALTADSPNYDGTVHLTATVFTTENPVTDGEFDTTDNNNQASKGFDVTWTPEIDPPSIKVNGGVDDVQVKEDGTVDVRVEAALDPNAEPAEYLTVTITGIPANWGFSSTVGTYAAGTWTVTLPAGDALDTVLTFTPPAQSDIDLTGLVATATATDPIEGISASANDGFNIIVDAVADLPSINADGGTGVEGTYVAVNIAGALGVDTDGSESIDHYEVSGATGYTFNQGTDLGSGLWSFTPAQLAGLMVKSNDANFDGSHNFTAMVYTKDTPTDGEFDTTDNTNSASDPFTVTWTPKIDPPTISVNNGVDNVQVKEDGTVNVSVKANLSAGAEPAEFLIVTITGFDPAWGNVTAPIGTWNPAHTEWSVTLAPGQSLDTLFTFTPNAQSDIDMSGLVATATAIDPIEDTFASASDSFNVIVDAVADKPSIDASAASGIEEGHPIAITLNGSLGADTDGSEHIDHYEISGVPAGFTFNQGTNLGGGVWSFTVAQTAGLQIISIDPTFAGTLNLTAKVVNTENPVSDGEFDTSDNYNNATDALTVTWEDDDEPVLVQPEHVTVDETNLAPTTSVTDKVEADFGDDFAGSYFSVNGNYTLPTGLTSLGDAVTVTFAQVLNGNGEYTGTAGGRPVFTLTLEADGDYTFTLYDTLDHPVDGPTAADHDDPLDLKFGVTATDSDGDTDNGFITVTVRDDGPIARSDFNQFDVTMSNKDYNIVLVLDVSGSMSGSKLALLKSSVSNLLGDFNSYDGGEVKVHIVPFSSTAGAGETFTVTDGAGYSAAISYLNGLSAGGNTNYEAPLQSAINWLQGATANDPITGADTYTYFISDGEPNRYVSGSSSSATGSATEVMNQITGSDGTNEVATLQGLSTEVISVGIGVSSTTLARLGQIDSDGTALDVQNPNDLDAALASTNPIVGMTNGNVITGVNGGAGAVDYQSQDTDNLITQIAFNGTIINVPTIGVATIDGDFGTLKIASDGSYTYELFGSYTGGAIQDTFVYTVTDGDGDTSSANLVLQGKFSPVDAHVEVNNGIDEVHVKEDGSVFVSVDGGYTGGNGNETLTLTLTGVGSGWGFTGTGWTSLGGGSYQITLSTGTSSYHGGFTLTPPAQSDIDLSGLSVTATVTGPDAEDSATSSDGFNVIVDAVADVPSITANGGTAEEGTPIGVSVQGFLGVDTDGSEHIDHYTISGATGYTFNHGTNLGGGVWSFTPAQLAGLTISSVDPDFDGTVNLTATVYTTENPVSDGEYDTTDNNNQASTNFTVTWTEDDVPVITQPEIVSVDETNLNPITTVSDAVTADFGGDAPGTFSANGTYFIGSLTSKGTAVTVDYNAANNTYSGFAGSRPVFTLTIDADGSYFFKLYDTIDHPDTTDHNDFLPLQFGVTATDSDGDSANGVITVRVYDDGLTAHNDFNQYDSSVGHADGNVVTGLNGGTGAADDVSKDTPNNVTQISFGGTTKTVTAAGVSIDGDHGTLFIKADGSYTYTAFGSGGGSGGTTEHHFAGGPGVFPDMNESQALDANEQQARGIAPGDLDVAAGDVMSMTYVGEYAGYSNTVGVFTIDADGSLVGGTVLIKNTDATAPGTTFTYTAGAGATEAGFFIIADGADLNSLGGIDFSTGSIEFIYGYGTAGERTAKVTDNGSNITLVYNDGAGHETVLSGPVYYSSERGAGNMNPDGKVHVVADLANESDDTVLRIGFEDLPSLGDKDYNDAIFDVSIASPDDCGCGSDVFTYTLADGDGDTDTATLTLECNPDDAPILGPIAEKTVDETNLSPTTAVSGVVTADFGNDGPGSFSANGAYTLPGGLTSNGLAVTVATSGNTLTGSTTAGDVFKMVINSNGSYTFTLLDTIDHPNKANHNDALQLSFGVRATDADSDSVDGTITINVLDDGLTAHNDVNQYDSVAGATGGNVIAGLNGGAGAADDLSQDTANTVSKITFGGTTKTVTAAGVSIDGDHGTLFIKADGSYTYTEFGGTGSTTNTVHTLNVTSGDVAGTAASINKNGFTLTSSTGGDLKWVTTTDGSGVGIVGDGTDKIYNSEKLFVGLPEVADSVKVTISDIGSNNLHSGVEFKVYVEGGTYVNYEFNIGSTTPVNGVINVTLDATTLGLPAGTHITGFDLYSSDAGSWAKTSQLLQNVESTTYGEADCGCDTDTFTYTIKDGDGDTSTATLTLECADPLLIVGENVSDHNGSTTDYRVGTGEGEIFGGLASDVLIGDVGGSRLENQDKDYNVTLILDVSGSMGSPTNSSSRLYKLIAATENLLNDLGAYNGGDVKVHIVPFSTNAYTGGTFTVTESADLAAAINFLHAMPHDGWTNYEAALQSAIGWLNGSSSNDPIPGAETITYFISDGEPNYYLDNNGNVVSNDSANTSMNQINGNGDATDEIAMIQSLSDEVIGVGIEVGSTTLARLGQIDSDGTAINVTNANDLDIALQSASPLNKLAAVGDDVINGGAGNDFIFGDAVNTDALAIVKGLGTPAGAGWEVFAQLESTSGWDRQDTIDYITDHVEELGAESLGSLGEGRVGGDDVINGGAGNDVIFGQEGDDVLAGGLGDDTLYGGSGADRFLFEAIADNDVDTIKDFDVAEGDELDLSQLLQGTSATQATIDQFVFANDNGTDTTLSVDVSGSGNPANATVFAVLEGVTGKTIDDLSNNGSLLVA